MHPSYLGLFVLPGLACVFPAPNWGSFLSLFLDRLPISCSFFSPSGTPMMQKVGMIEVVPEAAYTILIFFLLGFLFLFVLVGCFLLLYVPKIIDLNVSFTHSTVVSLKIILYVN